MLWVDLVASFAAQGAVLAVLATLVLAGARRWLRAVAFALLLVPDGYSLGRALADPPAVGPAIATVYTANLGQSPAAAIAAAEQIVALEPAIVWLSEFPDPAVEEVVRAFAEVERAYAYGVAWPAAEGRSLKLLSRFPLRAYDEFNPRGAPGRPALRLQIDAGGRPLLVLALHTHPPLADWAQGARNETLEWVSESSAATDGNVLLLGDLNTSAFAPRFARLVREAELHCASPWTCAVASWPAQLLPLLTPIDHVLVGGDLVIASLRRGPATGSDHYPVIAEIAHRIPALRSDES